MNIISVDLNTKYIAYAHFSDGALIEYGRVLFESTLDNKIGSVTSKIIEKFDGYPVDIVVYENSYLANSPKTMSDLSKVIGAMIGGFYYIGVHRFVGVMPITWQNGIGVKRTTPENMLIMKNRYPDKSMSWIKAKDRSNRKQLIIDHVNAKYSIALSMDTNDEADAIGLGTYAMQKWPELEQ
jgi:hypothetical protein